MTKMDNILANLSSKTTVIARRPGPPKGTPRPAGAGRKKGTPNKSTRDVREAAQKYSARALKTLVRLLADPDPRVNATAAREILDRAHGRPMTPSEITGKDGAPLINAPVVKEMSNFEVARRVAFILQRGITEKEKEVGNCEAGSNAVPIPK